MITVVELTRKNTLQLRIGIPAVFMPLQQIVSAAAKSYQYE